MNRTVHGMPPQPFNPVRSFTALVCGMERITIKEEYMPSFDLIGAISTARKTYEAGVSVRGSIASGGDPEPLLADLHARFKEQATAMGYLVERIDADASDTTPEDEIARRYAEGHEKREAAE